MNRYWLGIAISAALIAGISGAVRAEVNEAPAPTEQAKSNPPAPAPMPRPHPLAASRRVLPDQSPTSASPLPQPGCDWFACAQYAIVGIGF
jgi:hypothetical protein